MVKESFTPEQVPHRVHGVTVRGGQVVRIDCSVTIVYDVNEATGSTVLVQRYVVHLRTRPLPRGTAYAFDCTGPPSRCVQLAQTLTCRSVSALGTPAT